MEDREHIIVMRD